MRELQAWTNCLSLKFDGKVKIDLKHEKSKKVIPHLNCSTKLLVPLVQRADDFIQEINTSDYTSDEIYFKSWDSFYLLYSNLSIECYSLRSPIIMDTFGTMIQCL